MPDGTGIGWNWDATALVQALLGDVVIRDLAAAAGGGLTMTGETWLPRTFGAKGYPRAANTSDRIVNHCYWAWGINGLQVLDLAASPPTTTQVTNAGELPGSFSPDDTRLVYCRNSRIYTSAANGTDERLIRAPIAGNNSSVFDPYWKHN